MAKVNTIKILFCLLMLGCALKPIIRTSTAQVVNPKAAGENWAFPYWHDQAGTLSQLPLTAVEQRFAEGFPGVIGRFTDGTKVWVVRHVKETTRRLHPAVDCFRGLGYRIEPPKVVKRADGSRWRCFLAERGAKLQVCERIFDTENRQWTDVSAWYWENLFRQGQQDWWAVTEVSRAGQVNS